MTKSLSLTRLAGLASAILLARATPAQNYFGLQVVAEAADPQHPFDPIEAKIIFPTSPAILQQPHPYQHQHPASSESKPSESTPVPAAACFPSADFTMPGTVPSSTAGWWCDPATEYAFLGFSYEVSECQSLAKLKREFKDVAETFGGRYIRMYGACDRSGFYDDVIAAAWEAGIGVHSLIWFGFDNTNEWKTRRDKLLATLHSNPKAKFVTRALQFGSEPLYDYVLDPEDLAAQIIKAKANVSTLGIPVTISELAYGYQVREDEGSQAVLDAIDIIDAHILPYFAQTASTSDKSWPLVTNDLEWFIENGGGKKIYFSQNGWPSEHYPGVEPNSPDAVSDIPNEKAYFDLLDSKCWYFKSANVGWFAHIYSDSQEPGYGIYDEEGDLKFDFSPRSTC